MRKDPSQPQCFLSGSSRRHPILAFGEIAHVASTSMNALNGSSECVAFPVAFMGIKIHRQPSLVTALQYPHEKASSTELVSDDFPILHGITSSISSPDVVEMIGNERGAASGVKSCQFKTLPTIAPDTLALRRMFRFHFLDGHFPSAEQIRSRQF